MRNSIYADWISDLPNQFTDKKNLNVLLMALARQLQAVRDVFDELDSIVLDTATGQSLDMLGTIIPLTRKDATAIVRKAKNTELTDDYYRSCLKYQALKNTCDCTYEDIMDSIHVLWETDNIRYEEDVNHPAHINLQIKNIDINKKDPAYNRVLALKPSGVSLFYAYSMQESLKNKEVVNRMSLEMYTNIIEALLKPSFFMEDNPGKTYYLDGELLMDSNDRIVPSVFSNATGMKSINTETMRVSCLYDGDLEEI